MYRTCVQLEQRLETIDAEILRRQLYDNFLLLFRIICCIDIDARCAFHSTELIIYCIELVLAISRSRLSNLNAIANADK